MMWESTLRFKDVGQGSISLLLGPVAIAPLIEKLKCLRSRRALAPRQLLETNSQDEYRARIPGDDLQRAANAKQSSEGNSIKDLFQVALSSPTTYGISTAILDHVIIWLMRTAERVA